METRKLSRRQVLKLMGMGTAGAVLAACSPQQPAAPAAAPEATQAPTAAAPAAEVSAATKITMWTYPDDDIFFNASLKDFNEKYPNIAVEIVKLDAGDLDQKLTAAMVGGTGAPDIVDLEQGWIGKYAKQGGFADLNSLNVQQYAQYFPKFAWDAGYSADKSKYYFVYYSTAPAVIHYRRSLFDGAGLPSDPEEVRKLLCADWESYIATGEKIAKPDGPWMVDAADSIFYNYHYQNNPSWITADNVLNIDNKENLAGLVLAQTAREKGLDAKMTSWTPEWQNTFKSTTVASYLSGDWLQGLIVVYGGEGTKGDWGMLPLPGKISAANGGSTLSIPEQSQNKDAAWNYIEYFSFTVKPQVEMFVLTTCFPGYMPAWDDPIMQEPVEWYGGQRSRLISVEVAKNFSDRLYSAYDQTIGEIVGTEVANVLDQGKDPAQALADAQATAEQQLEL
jgi:multiple sugar transport system substrate-binding protein